MNHTPTATLDDTESTLPKDPILDACRLEIAALVAQVLGPARAHTVDAARALLEAQIPVLQAPVPALEAAWEISLARLHAADRAVQDAIHRLIDAQDARDVARAAHDTNDDRLNDATLRSELLRAQIARLYRRAGQWRQPAGDDRVIYPGYAGDTPRVAEVPDLALAA